MLGVRLSEPVPMGAMIQVRRLRLPLAICVVSLVAAGALQIWCLIEGCLLLLHGLPGDCEAARQWLVAYCVSLAMVPFANIVAIAAQVWWVTGGSVNVVSNHCREVAPYLIGFIRDVQLRGLWTLLLLVIFSFSLVFVRKLQMSLREVWASGAPTLRSVINAVMQRLRQWKFLQIPSAPFVWSQTKESGRPCLAIIPSIRIAYSVGSIVAAAARCADWICTEHFWRRRPQAAPEKHCKLQLLQK